MTFYRALEKNDPVEEAIQVCSNAEASCHLEVCRYLQLCSRTSDLDYNSLTHLETILMKIIVDKQSKTIDFFNSTSSYF
jgi:predicted nucleic acid-binding OB-fold protein